MGRALAVIAAMGCGRFAFDPVPPGTTGDEGTADAFVDIDSAFAPTTDAPAAAATLRFGECANADVTQVTTDTFLDLGRPTENFGRRDEMRVGNTRNSIVRFDLAAISVSAQVFSATLEVSVSSDAKEYGYVAIHRVLEPWTEGTGDYTVGVCNWDIRTGTTAWASPGGSHSPAVIGTFTPAVSDVRHSVALDPTAVQTWVGGQNFGLILIGVDDMGSGGWLMTKEGADPATRPCLSVTYVP